MNKCKNCGQAWGAHRAGQVNSCQTPESVARGFLGDRIWSETVFEEFFTGRGDK